MSKKVQVSARKLLWAHAWALDFPQAKSFNGNPKQGTPRI